MKAHTLALVGLLVVIAASCTTSNNAMFEMNEPGSLRAGTVSDVTTRGEYIDARVVGKRYDLRLLFANTPGCQQLLRPEAQVAYVKTGLYGMVSQGSKQCDAVGVLSLKEWLRSHYTSGHGQLMREDVAYQVIFRDSELAFVRGTFRLAKQLGLSGSWDVLAVLPVADCAEAIDSGNAYLEFLEHRSSPFELLSGENRCPVLGFAQVDAES